MTVRQRGLPWNGLQIAVNRAEKKFSGQSANPRRRFAGENQFRVHETSDVINFMESTSVLITVVLAISQRHRHRVSEKAKIEIELLVYVVGL